MGKTLPAGLLVDTVEIRTSHPDFSSALIISFTFGFGRIIQWPVKALNSSGTPSIQVHNIPNYLLYLSNILKIIFYFSSLRRSDCDFDLRFHQFAGLSGSLSGGSGLCLDHCCSARQTRSIHIRHFTIRASRQLQLRFPGSSRWTSIN